MTDRILPEHIYPTSYANIFVTKSGDAYREPVKGERMPINEYGLVYLNPAYRGHKDHPEKQYKCVNITLRDENGKFIKQIKKSNHQLVAETFIPNPHGYTEVLHGDKGHLCNHVDNLRWGTHKENMGEASHTLPEGSIRIHNRNVHHNQDGYKRNPTKYIKQNGEWVLIPSDRPAWNKGKKGSSWNTLPDGTVRTRKVNGKDGIFIKQNGKWVYQTDNPKPRKKK